MHTRKTLKTLLGGLSAAAMLYAAPALPAETLRYAHGNPPSAASVKVAQRYKEQVVKYSDGELDIRVFPNSLLSIQEMSAGLYDGLADIGALFTSYFPSEYPHFNMVADMSMLATNTDKDWKIGLYAFTGALMDYVFFDCPQCHEEFARRNQVYMGGWPSTSYGLACTKPITTLDDIKGLPVRAVGASWARWTEFVGANAITMPGSEMLQALAQGVVGCVELSLTDLFVWGVHEVTTDFTIGVPGGIFAQVAGMQVNADVWKRLTPKQRLALMRGSAAQAAGALALYIEQDEAAIARIQSEGRIRLYKPAADLWARTEAFMAQDRHTITQYYAENFGIANGAAQIDKIVDKFNQWLMLMDGVQTGAQAEAIYWERLYSKLDPAAYGL